MINSRLTRSRTCLLVVCLLFVVWAGRNAGTGHASATGASVEVAAAAAIDVSDAAASAPLVRASDLVYQGAFRLPQGPIAGSSFDYGGTALAFNAAQGSLFMVGHAWQQQVAEVTIPTPGRGSLSSLPTASVLQPFVDLSEGRMLSVGFDPVSDNPIVGGLLAYRGRLYESVYLYYDGLARQVRSHFVSGLDLSVRGDASGPYQVGPTGMVPGETNAGFVDGYMGLVPSAWQAALGGPVLTGNCCIPLISRSSYGPAAFAIDPAQFGVVDPIPAVPLVYYPSQHQTLATWGSTSTLFNGATQMTGVVFPEGTRSVLFFGRQGLGPFCYGESTDDPALNGTLLPGSDVDLYCYDPADQSKGTHAYPYAYYVWAYDALDLAAVKSGQRQPWDVTPYAVWTLDLPSGVDYAAILGAAYDPQTGRIFVSQAYGDGSSPLIHVFTVGGGSSVPVIPPTVSLSSPANGATFAPLAAIKVTATANDSDGSVSSVAFYANGTWIGTDATRPYSIDWSIAEVGAYQLIAIATDNQGNTATSTAATIAIRSGSTPPSSPGPGASPDGSRVPDVSAVTDSSLAVWTLGSRSEVLRNGVQAGGGYGSQILWYRGSISVLGDDRNWWTWTGTTWTFAGANDPSGGAGNGGGSGGGSGGSSTPSPSGTRIPAVSSILDNSLAVWTLGPRLEILRNGSQAAGAYGSQILWYQGVIYVRGDDSNWWKWTGSTWVFYGANAPG